MDERQPRCTQSCRELCNAIEYASKAEKEAILQYAYFRDACTYPDVKTILNELIIQKKKSIELLEKTKEALRAKFEVLDQIRSSFDAERQ
jgi:rubrerythrin